MTVVNIVQVLWAISAAGLIALILIHSPKGDGIGGIGGQAQMFNTAKTAESSLNTVTWGFAIVFIGLTVILSAGWLAARGG